MRKAFCDECGQEMPKAPRGFDHMFEPKPEDEVDPNWASVSYQVGGMEKPKRFETHKGECLTKALERIGSE